ncbi:ABC transporter ATP-binding protein [Gemmatimonadota bacterium]
MSEPIAPRSEGEAASVPILRSRELHKSYESVGEPLHVLRGVDLDIQAGESVAIMGASGTGKSTLLHVLGALDRPSAGKVELEGRDLNTLWDEALAEIRNRRIGFIFQFHHLLPEFTAAENIAMPAMIGGVGSEEALDRASDLLAAVGLSDRADHRPNELSGGEKQRVAVARALVNRPAVVLADEPSGNLDEASSERLHELLLDLHGREGQTLLLVTHDARLAGRAGRVLELAEGILHPRG